VVILDEPTAGVDPRSALAVRRDLAALTRGRTVVWSSHDLAEVEELCTHVVILDRGRVAAEGRMDELRGAGRVLRVELAPARARAPDLEALVGALAGVDRVELDEAGGQLRLYCDPARSMDEVTQSVLQLLLDRGLFVRGLSRGERFAERFWAATQPER
jgi:ABC-type multidrug transport system ATPase subunit